MKELAPFSLAEQVVAAELAYYQLVEACPPTAEEGARWQRRLALYRTLNWAPTVFFERFVLEARGQSLHRYMARHLSPRPGSIGTRGAAWSIPFGHEKAPAGWSGLFYSASGIQSRNCTNAK